MAQSHLNNANLTSRKVDYNKIIFFISDLTEHRKTHSISEFLMLFLTSHGFDLTLHKIFFCIWRAENSRVSQQWNNS